MLRSCGRWVVVALLLDWSCAARSLADESVSAPRSFAYVLQADAAWKSRSAAVAALAHCDRDWIVIDAAYTAGPDGRWTPDDLKTIRDGKPGRRVLAYLSIGEAEDYRDYWQKTWDADRDGKPDAWAPDFLMPENPDWTGNYRVRYWREAWQKLILSEIDRIVAQGFDGAYLDIVDGFETFEFNGKDWIDDRRNEETGRTYREDMIAWVKKIGERLRKEDAKRLLIPQNGSQLLANDAFVQFISGVGMEDVFTNGNRAQRAKESNPRLKDVEPLIKAGKPVLLIEYPKKEPLRQAVVEQAHKHGFVWLMTDRQLKTLGESGN
ncbi:MAG TPA: MJ1477/TM1410 family putative glycoside hydrolase [Pirellulales bacterium]|nr:MJ1477/TM1410 family putative glycoside hydrolase [Pirellulales bacterium]